MGDILRRRGMMLVPSSGPTPTPEWDFEWSYEDGLPGDNGWTKTTDGTTTETLEETRLKVTAKSSNKYISYAHPHADCTKAVFEAKIKGGSTTNYLFYVSFTPTAGGNSIQLRAQYSTNYKGLYLNDASAIADMTKLESLSGQFERTLKIVVDSGYVDIYSNDNLLVSGVDLTTLTSITDPTRVRFVAASSSTYTGYIYYARAKIGRIS